MSSEKSKISLDKDEKKHRVYYHYTDEKSHKLIKDSGYIKASSKENNGDAAFGDGVYLTTRPPTTPKHEIARNNYDDGADFRNQKQKEGKVNAYVKVRLPVKDVKMISAKNRDVHLYPGDLHLAKYDSKSDEEN